MVEILYTAKNAQVATSLLQVAMDLLQVDCQNFLSTDLLQVVSTSCNKSANGKLQRTWF